MQPTFKSRSDGEVVGGSEPLSLGGLDGDGAVILHRGIESNVLSLSLELLISLENGGELVDRSWELLGHINSRWLLNLDDRSLSVDLRVSLAFLRDRFSHWAKSCRVRGINAGDGLSSLWALDNLGDGGWLLDFHNRGGNVGSGDGLAFLGDSLGDRAEGGRVRGVNLGLGYSLSWILHGLCRSGLDSLNDSGHGCVGDSNWLAVLPPEDMVSIGANRELSGSGCQCYSRDMKDSPGGCDWAIGRVCGDVISDGSHWVLWRVWSTIITTIMSSIMFSLMVASCSDEGCGQGQQNGGQLHFDIELMFERVMLNRIAKVSK